ncbi:NAD(P)-binding protein [Byssothecium circinans]|uniref:NAD(P)-binding protein n=1 Tax=Byssothecium circinans TaxID=147558 RepID=A0A6A5UQX0_9PLEO|nr:NAD(P)-binding protein [Byssothecium circinans]
MAAQEKTLKGKVALISGLSLGLSAAIARELFDLLASLNPPSRSLAIEADLSTKEGLKILADAAAKAFTKIDILVNCAGIARTFPLDDLKVSAISEGVINLNARGTFFLARAVLLYLSHPSSSIYSGSKSMVKAFTQCTINGVASRATSTETFLAAPHEVRDLLKPFINITLVAPRLETLEEVTWVVAMLCREKANRSSMF